MSRELTESPHRVAERIEGAIEQLENEFHRAYWDSQVRVSPDTERRRAELELELRTVKGDPADLRAVESALADTIHDPVLKRRLQVLRRSLLGNQMDEDRRAELVDLQSSVESDFAAFRPVVGGRRVSDNEIEEVLRTSNDETERRAVWEASKAVGASVADRVRELARIRNAAARDLGFPDYYNLSLELQELDEEWLYTLLEEVERVTDEPFRRWKSALDARLAERFGTTDLYPWHYADPFFQQLPPDGRVSLDGLLRDRDAADLARATFARWGIDLTGVLERSDLYPREGKSQHAFCLDVDRSGRDVRILANVVPGERWVEVMLHESGHAAYDLGIDRRLPYSLRRPAHIFVTEAIAILSGRLLRDAVWLREILGAPEGEIAVVEDALGAANRAQMVLFARWALVMIHFERDLYLDPDADLDDRWWELVERFQLVRRPNDRHAPDWAAKIHVAVAPVYYQNYLLGEILASQLAATCIAEYGGLVGVREAGGLLADRVFHPGALLRWDSLVEGATGGPLSAAEFGRELV
ncbi:MAG TPA: M2 family metallopeptidase [Actinomycetota bacterium]|nr:M2 family metallopeptidase [Actinomycetota bacterium]